MNTKTMATMLMIGVCIPACSGAGDLDAEDDLVSASEAVTTEERQLVGDYEGREPFKHGQLSALSLKTDNTFAATRMIEDPRIRCVRAPCLRPEAFTGRWRAFGADASRLYLQEGSGWFVRHTVTRAADGGPIVIARGDMKHTLFPRRTVSDAELTTGAFTLSRDAAAAPTKACEPLLSMSISRSFTGYTAKIEDAIVNPCPTMIAFDARPRTYALSFAGTGCGSTTWTGTAKDARGETRTVEITDHGKRTCRDLVPSKIVVKETRGDQTVTWFQPRSVTVEGTLVSRAGVGGESTGFALRTSSGEQELVLTAAQRATFVEGRVARAIGAPTVLRGVETRDRAAVSVTDLLVCPAPGSTINCMPPTTNRMCAPADRTFVSSRCPRVEYLD
jgi:hypothetical protein